MFLKCLIYIFYLTDTRVFASLYTRKDIKKDVFLYWLHLILDGTIIVIIK